MFQIGTNQELSRFSLSPATLFVRAQEQISVLGLEVPQPSLVFVQVPIEPRADPFHFLPQVLVVLKEREIVPTDMHDAIRVPP